jgi:hypothetical protein
MVDTANIIGDVTSKVTGTIGSVNWMYVIGWIILLIVLCAGGYWFYAYSKNKKIFSKKITAFETVGEYWSPVIRDLAKVVKIGKGGFEILYLKTSKTWKIAYGGRVGRSDYYFFIMPDGYWYNSMLKAGVNYMDNSGGLVPIVTTNPLMRGQYTALEKQIDSLHGEKVKFWDKYGSFILSIAFMLIGGVLLWLMFREFSSAMGQLTTYHNSMAELLDKVNRLLSTTQTPVNSGGLIPA